MPNGAFNICCPRDCVSRHNGGTSGAPLKPLRVDSVFRILIDPHLANVSDHEAVFVRGFADAEVFQHRDAVGDGAPGIAVGDCFT